MNGAATLGVVGLASGGAALTISNLSVGTQSLTVSYHGDVNDNASTSAAVSQVVNKMATSVTLASNVNPSSSQSVTFTASVSPSTATGSITFLDGGVSLGSARSGAEPPVSRRPRWRPGGHPISASYSGDGNDLARTSAILTQNVTSGTKKSTTTVLSSNLNPSTSDTPPALKFVGSSSRVLAKLRFAESLTASVEQR